MHSHIAGKRERAVGPKYLCFLEEDGKRKWSKVSDWTGDTKYIFISFTRQHYPSLEWDDLLHDVGKQAAKTADLQAF